jgi:hypothetical protein
MRERLRRTQLEQRIGEHLYPTVSAAVDACARQTG